MLEIQVRRKQGDFNIDVDFKVEATGVTALFGTSGAGKTSVINMVAGLNRPDAGHIVLAGRCLFNSEMRINLPPEKRRVGYVFQDARLFPHLSVRTNLTYGMRLLKEDQRYVQVDQVVDLLGIESILDRRPAKLSGGEKQRVAIGRAFLCSPVMLLMDEPLASLDGGRRAEVLPFIRRLCKDFSIPILYVSHLLDEIAILADHLVVMESGRVLASDSFQKFRTDPKLQGLMQHNGCGEVLQGLFAGVG